MDRSTRTRTCPAFTAGVRPPGRRSTCTSRLFAPDERVPDRQEGLVVEVESLLADGRDLVGVPVALEVLAVLPDRGLPEVQRVLDVPRQRPALRAEGHRPGRGGLPDLEPALRPEGMDVPVDVDDVEPPGRRRLLLPGALRGLLGAHAPTSARIAPGPSSLFPSSSSVAPTRIEILPRCLFSWRSWCASPTPSKPITRQSTGWILPSAISWFARMHS